MVRGVSGGPQLGFLWCRGTLESLGQLYAWHSCSFFRLQFFFLCYGHHWDKSLPRRHVHTSQCNLSKLIHFHRRYSTKKIHQHFLIKKSRGNWLTYPRISTTSCKRGCFFLCNIIVCECGPPQVNETFLYGQVGPSVWPSGPTGALTTSLSLWVWNFSNRNFELNGFYDCVLQFNNWFVIPNGVSFCWSETIRFFLDVIKFSLTRIRFWFLCVGGLNGSDGGSIQNFRQNFWKLIFYAQVCLLP